MKYKKDDFSFLVMYLEQISAFAPLPVRIIAGIAFILHGLPKFENLQGTQGFFASVGIPADLALLIGLLEVIGGVLLIVGLLTRITSILFTIEMICAVLIVKADNSFMGQGGFEVDLLLMFISISLLLSGPGRVSIERDLLKREIFPKISYKKNDSSDKR
ncbi:Putative oxidoreductase CatD [Candidatus Nitrosocosmicus oleophilus]|jgi:putative oxidoreductase|uniref:Oxidoreductase CatD n=1 Tax=Candidatus Nitrosocosmicus oleophilus TaxID=1353260 RepID=A0A654LX35_9ARCH|nr:DoxX family protein [Candidatus Nitrosocosmicus oleophilus]ALI34893.1 Putative oxidoreductase CatD [Candidatus Nitrosocosmicus oleophilus]